MQRPTIGMTNVITTADMPHIQVRLTDAVPTLLQEENGEAPLYDLLGRRILHPQPGNIYIQNGKKILYR